MRSIKFDLSPAGAIFSEDRTRRYALWREVNYDFLGPDLEKYVLFIGLNPSIANETRLDPTVTRCYNYAKRWGFRYLLMGNLYSKVSTDPKNVRFNDYERENMEYLVKLHLMAEQTILAWGTHAEKYIACLAIKNLIDGKGLYCLGVNQDQSPKHPLYLRGDVKPQLYEAHLK